MIAACIGFHNTGIHRKPFAFHEIRRNTGDDNALKDMA
jgi:hypothetical protein